MRTPSTLSFLFGACAVVSAETVWTNGPTPYAGGYAGPIPAPTYVSLFSDSRFSACWIATTFSSVSFVKASTGWASTPVTNNTPNNAGDGKKWCVYSDITTDLGLSMYTTLRQARSSNRQVNLSADDATRDPFLGWKLLEITVY